ncbi:MAG: FAD-dependent oxidoreductase [Actinomycetota bacterium]
MAQTIDADVCIVGAGIAGLFAACSLPPGTSIAVVDKGVEGEGSSPLAQGGLAAAVDPGDSWELHLKDTISAGAGLVDERAAEIVCREAPGAVEALIDLGCDFDRLPDGSLHLAREGGQSVPRSVHRADATGAEIVRVLRDAARSRVNRVAGYAFRLATHDGECRGVWAAGPEGVILIRADHTLLAAGGAGALFASTTNNPASTGDGIALAERDGVRLTDLEFVQFHPTALAVDESPRPLLTEALRGAGAVLVDAKGERIMAGSLDDTELAPRHVVTAAILAAGETYLDARAIGEKRLIQEFPTVVSSCRSRGFDPATQLIPVAPAAHYLIGGIETDLDGRASLPGLFAGGECAATGVHGANRLAGNSLSESVVFARRAAGAMADERAARRRGDPEWEPPREASDEARSHDIRPEIIEAVTLGAGPIRDALSAREALARIEKLREVAGESVNRSSAGTRAMLTAGALLVRAALAREETRGVHVRSDFPETDPALDGVHYTY